MGMLVQFDRDSYWAKIPDFELLLMMSRHRSSIFLAPIFVLVQGELKAAQLTLSGEAGLFSSMPSNATFMPVLDPLDKRGKHASIDGENWEIVSGGSLYQNEKPIRLPSAEMLRVANLTGENPVFIGDTEPGLELKWFLAWGRLMAVSPLCYCTPEELQKAGLVP